MKPSIRISAEPASCTIAGTKPCIFLKSISISSRASLFPKNKKPAELVGVSGLNSHECWFISGMHPRRRARARDDNGGDGDETTSTRARLVEALGRVKH